MANSVSTERRQRCNSSMCPDLCYNLLFVCCCRRLPPLSRLLVPAGPAVQHVAAAGALRRPSQQLWYCGATCLANQHVPLLPPLPPPLLLAPVLLLVFTAH